MAAATKASSPEGKLDYDAVILTLTDGETYTTDLSTPYGCLLTEANSDSTAGAAVNLDYELSGRTFTLRYKQNAGTPVTDKKVALLAYGRK